MKNFILSLVLCGCCAIEAFCADTLSYRVKQLGNWAFYGTDNPVVELSVSNNRGISKPFNLSCLISDYTGKPVYRLAQRGIIPSKDSALVAFSFLTVTPGVYNASMMESDVPVRGMNIIYEPEKIAAKSSDDGAGRENFALFADMVSLERRDIKPQFTIARNKAMSGREKNVYDFKMVSRSDEQVLGYMAFPKGKSGLPVMVTFVMQQDKSANPLADFTAPAGVAELVVYLKERGDGAEYFKNLLTDMALSLDFVFQRKETDPTRVYTQGRGIAGVCSFLSGILDSRVAVSFAADPDFAEFTQFFSLESLSSPDDVPLLLGLGLQQNSYTLQETFSIYNRVKATKEYFVFPYGATVERREWIYVRDIFLKRTGK